MTDVDNTEYLNSINFVDEQEREHFAKAQLGEQVRSFLASPAGRYLHGRAKLLLAESQEAALECNADSFFGRRKLKRIQSDAEVAKKFMTWCAEAIVEGEMSFRELQNY